MSLHILGVDGKDARIDVENSSAVAWDVGYMR